MNILGELVVKCQSQPNLYDFHNDIIELSSQTSYRFPLFDIEIDTPYSCSIVDKKSQVYSVSRYRHTVTKSELERILLGVCTECSIEWGKSVCLTHEFVSKIWYLERVIDIVVSYITFIFIKLAHIPRASAKSEITTTTPACFTTTICMRELSMIRVWRSFSSSWRAEMIHCSPAK